MQAPLISIAILTVIYTVLLRRRIDLMSIAVAACVAYYSPILYGLITFHEQTAIPTAAASVVVAFQFVVLLGCMAVSDMLGLVCRRSPLPATTRWDAFGITIVCLGLLVAAFAQTPWESLTSPDKHRVMADSIGVFRSVGSIAAGLLPIVVARNRRLFPLLVSFGPAAFILYLGFRFPIVWGVCGVALIAASRNFPRPVLLTRQGVMLAVVGFGILFVALTYKHVYKSVKSGQLHRLEATFDRLVATPEHIIMVSEPQSISNMLDKVIKTDFLLSQDHFVDAGTSLLTPGSGWRERNFNARFQARFYSDRAGRVGNSPLAEIWAWGGAPWTVIGILLWGVVLVVLNVVNDMTRRSLAASTVTLLGIVWAVNWHRNDIRFTLILTGSAAGVWAMSVVVAAAMRFISRLRRSASGRRYVLQTPAIQDRHQ
jgi:hypothetical protein